MPSGFNPTLSMSYNRVFTWRNTKPETGSRRSGLNEPEPKSKRRNALIEEARFVCK